MVSVVAALKENSVLNMSLLSDLIYVHVLVTFVITFGGSSVYQYCYFFCLTVGDPTVQEKLILDPFSGKKKR